MPSTKPFAVILGSAALVAVALAVQAGMSLRINGAVATTDVRVINGKAYVPLADVAKALDMTVSKSGAGYTMERGGGANAITGYSGKQGTEVFTGKWRFAVLDWKRVDSFRTTLMQRNSWDDHYEAKPSEDLIVVSCRVKNGTKATDELVFPSQQGWDGVNTALTDDQEQAHIPVGYDVAETEGAPPGTKFLPGAAINFKMVFRVPKGTQPKDVIFTALRYGMRAGYDQKKDPPQDIRVALAKEQ